MSWLSVFSSTLNWWQWALLLSVPPAIVLLYFLKLKRQPLEVPSTYLWHRTIEDLHVNSIWQRLRQNLLLFLQLLLLALAILACLRPSWRGTKLTDDRFIFLVDNSASMSATDLEPSRLEEAKRQVGMLIDEMKSGDVAMIIAFSDRARAIQPYTDNRRILKRNLAKIKPTQRGSDLDQALRFAAGLANPGRSAYSEGDAAAAEALPATMFIFSDGRVRSQPKMSMGNLEPLYIRMGTPDAVNVAIAAFQSGQNPEKPDKMQAFASFENFTEADRTVQVNLYLNDSLIDAARIDVPAEGTGGAEFTLDNIESGVLKLQIEDRDHLSVDNSAYSVLNVPRRAKLLYVTPGNDFMELALNTEQVKKVADVVQIGASQLDAKEYLEPAAAGAYDLVIFDQCAPEKPEQMPEANTLFIGRTPPGDEWSAEPVQPIPQIIDIDRVHPLMQFIEMNNVEIAECTPLNVPKGGTVLIDSDVGVLLAIAPRGGFEDAVLAFEIIGRNEAGEEEFNTLWPRRPSFPVFIQNVLAYLAGVAEQRKAEIVQPGQIVQIRSESPADRITVETPSGQRSPVARSQKSAFVFGGTEETGVYTVLEGGPQSVRQQFAVNLFDSIESNIRPLAEIQTEYEQIEGQAAIERTRREAWKPLLLAALVVLVLEWYVYNRRVYL